jgi:DNA-binding CsgD family transcriptional regulator
VYTELSAVDRVTPLDGPDLVRLAIAAYLTGREAEAPDVLARAHAAYLDAGETLRAARSAFWAAFVFINLGSAARAAGWLARARRLVDEHGQPCAERGYLLLPIALDHAAKRDLGAANETFAEAARIGAAFREADLINLARQGQGRALINLGDLPAGLSLLDEVMVAVTSGEVSPIIAGTIYCSVISACFEICDVRRAQEWTEALDRWCASHPDIVAYRGQCLVHRAEIMALHGSWPDAISEARQACERLAQRTAQSAQAAAFYQLADLHRLRGEVADAEDMYGRVTALGRTPHPGLALLRLSQGQRDLARTAIRRALEGPTDRRARARLLMAAVSIFVACGDDAAAVAASTELTALADGLDTPFVRALSLHARGEVDFAGGRAGDAIGALQTAQAIWRDLDVPYEAARAGTLLACAYRLIGDGDAANAQIDSARHIFEALGARPDLEKVTGDDASARGRPSCPLTAREIQVLRLIARGQTNRRIADELAISEKTVARHVSNIFTKIDVSSRAGATAYAFQRQLV